MILVTGATGTSGVPVVEALLEHAARVRVLTRDPDKAAHLLGDAVEIARGDLGDVASIEAAMEGCDRALLNSSPEPQLVEHQRKFIKAAKRAGIEYVVKFSMASVDPKSQRTFARWHGEIEDALRGSGIAWTMLRPTFFMENLFALTPMIRECVVYGPTGEGRAAFVDTGDIAAVAAICLMEPGHEGKAYEITGPQSLSYTDVCATLERELDRPVHFRACTFEQAKENMLQTGMPEWLAQAINELSMGMKEGIFDKVTTVVRDIAKRRPRTLEEFVSDNIAAFR
jgi:uncharacterized protein YbjT (DUF2867 family)